MTVESPESARDKAHETAMLIAMVLVAIFVSGFHVSPLWEWAFLIHFELLMGGLAVVAYLNAALLVGHRNAVVFLLLGALIGYSAEQLGIVTGWVFGPYYYTDKLGGKIGDVPWVIPLCWFALVYFAHVIVNLAMHSHPVARAHRLAHSVLLAAMTALIATGFDVAMDPAMSHPDIHAWVWTDGGEYMGVPFRNFRGWIGTAFLIDLLYRLYAARFGTQPVSNRVRYASLVLLLTWFCLGLGYMMIGYPVETQIVAVFCIVLPALIALAALYIKAWNPEATPTGPH